MPSKMSCERELLLQKALALRGDGKSFAEISSTLKVPLRSINRWTKHIKSQRLERLVTLRERARCLRKEGWLIKEIAKELSSPKSSVTRWTKDVELSEQQRKEMYAHAHRKRMQGCANGSKKNKELRDLAHARSLEEGRKQAKADEKFRIICALYWGEGGKTRNSFAFSNSDFAMIELVAKWLVATGRNYKLQIVSHAGGLSDNELINYWSRLPGFDKSNLYKIQRKDGGRHGIPRMQYGCVHLNVYDVDLFFRVMGGIECLKSE